jgi:competence protein ComEC
MKKYFLIIILVLITAGSLFVIWQSYTGKLEIVFFDVGQGDSAFIETPSGFQVLVDGGPTSVVLDKLGQKMPFYDKTIDLIVLSHPDSDHLTGLLDVLKRYEVKNVLWTGVIEKTAEFDEWKKLLKEEGANIIIAQAGERLILQNNPLIYLDVLYPFEDLEGNEPSEPNDTSVVSRLIYNNNSFILVGDISQKIEKQLIEKYGNQLDSDILKVAHHGSKYSSSREFIEAVSPNDAVISVGENIWGHPTPETLQRLQNFGINVLITKEKGDIKFTF